MAKITTFEEMALHGLRDIYNAEKQELAAYPDMIAAATSDNLKKVFTDHMEQTKTHVTRLEQVFSKMNESPEGVTCHAAKGLIAEAKENIKEIEAGAVRDAALIASVQRLEHYEVSAYGTARTFATQLGDMETAKLLETTLNEEAGTDEKLNMLAVYTINPKAGKK